MDREQGLKGSTVKLQSSVLGEHCAFGEKVKIVNSLLMDSVEVGNGGLLENCIISTGAKIGANAVLKECLVGPKFIVPEGGKGRQSTNLLMMKCGRKLITCFRRSIYK